MDILKWRRLGKVGEPRGKKKNIGGELADGSAGVLRGFRERADATLIQDGGGGRWAAFEGRLQ